MIQEEMSMIDFFNKFSDDDACAKHLFNIRWPDKYFCPRCEATEYYFLKNRKLHQCKTCGYQISVTAGTIFHKTRIPLQKWFLLIYFMATSKSGISILSLKERIGMKSYQTTWHMSHKIRSAMGQRDSKYILNGYIDVDEAYFGGKSTGKQGRGSENKTCGLVMITFDKPGEYPKYVSIKSIQNASSDEILNVLKNKVHNNSKIRTDGWAGYVPCDDDYKNRIAIKCKTNEEKQKTFKWIHILISNFKGIIRGVCHGVKSKHYQQYFNEFAYRFNRRSMFAQLFNRLLFTAATSKVLTYSELIG